MATPSSAVFRAFADETRRDILKLLRSGPMTSGQIADRFDSSWPTISRHLSVLANAGLVVAIRRGAEVYYELNTSVLQDVVQHMMGWIEPLRVERGKSKVASRTSGVGSRKSLEGSAARSTGQRSPEGSLRKGFDNRQRTSP